MVQATKRYTLTFSTHNKVLQKTYFDFAHKDTSTGLVTVYALQMQPANHKDVELYRGTFNPNTESTISMDPYMNLVNFGHGQTFEVFTDDTDGSKWAWVATYASSTQASSDGDFWASRIGVIPLDGVDKNASSVPSITYLNYLGTGSKNMSMHRVDAALSSDTGRLAIWTESTGNSSATKRVTALNAKPLFEALKANGNINARDDFRMLSGGSFYVSTHDISSYSYPQNSWQGMELSNMTSAGYNWVYLTSGQAGQSTEIVRAPWNFSSPVTLTVSVPGVVGEHETEAPQLYGDDVYFGVEEKYTTSAGNESNHHYIYSIPKSAF